MSSAARSVYCFAFVFVMGGVGLLLIPHIVLPMLSLPSANDLFVRLLGLVMLILAYYYIRAARRELTDFFLWTVHARITGFGFYVVFYLLDIAPLVLLGLGVVDLLGALWTRWAIRSDRARLAKSGESGSVARRDSLAE